MITFGENAFGLFFNSKRSSSLVKTNAVLFIL